VRYYEAVVLVEAIKSTDTTDLPQYFPRLDTVAKGRATPLLRTMYAESEPRSKQRLHAGLALVPGDDSLVPELYERLLVSEPHEVIVIRDRLFSHRDALSERLWTFLGDRSNDPRQRLRAACALAAYAPDDQRWEGVGGDVASRLVAENALVIGK